ncbi:MAG: hypothetical protein NPIRA04_11740 [Nitrospirales bacterium]|nr:MAG: hypothetical protein NPIRA04_11740 [Nitrospirales bacterium]
MIFFESFTHTHQGWLVNITIMRNDVGAREWENGLPLEGLTHQLDNNISCVSIIVQQDSVPHGHLLYSIKGATQITFEQSENDEYLKLYVKSVKNVMTTITFQRAAVPDQQANPITPPPSLKKKFT